MHKKSYIIFTLLVTFIALGVIWQLQNTTQYSETKTKHYLNQEEKEWLKNLKKPLTVGITNIPNQVILDKNGKASGFSMDLLHIIENKLHTPFTYVSYTTWDTLMRDAKKGKIDIVFAAQKTPDRLQYLDFTDVVLTQQNKIIVQSKNHSFSDLDSLEGKKVALVQKSALFTYVQNKYPNIIVQPYETELDALQAVSAGDADATFSEPVRASYYMNTHNIQNLIVSGDLGYNYKLRIASQRDLPLLNVILSQIVANISPQELQALYLKWGYIKDKERYFDTQTLVYLAIAFGIILPFSLYLYFINRSLEREVAKRKTAERKLLALNKNLNEKVKQEVEKQREQELHMLQQSKLAQMGNMMNMIAHQWKQPLNVLSMLIQTVKHKHKRSKIDDEFIQYFDTNTKKQLDEITKTINDFMHYFRPKNESEFLINDIIKHNISIIEPLFLANNITIVYNNKSTKELTIHNDMIGQVIINILNNAKDALIENSIEHKIIHITLSSQNNHTQITIQDNAGGIAKKIIDKIFDPYFSTKNDKGTGLGLYMSKIIIETYYKGSLFVSNTDKGALFTITIS